MERLVNPYSDTNFFAEAFEDIFNNRAYDGELLWSIRDIYLQYLETCEIIGCFLRNHFSFDNQDFFNSEITNYLVNDARNLEKTRKYMSEINSLVTKFNEVANNFIQNGKLRANNLKKVLDESASFWKSISEKRKLIKNFATSIYRWIERVEKDLLGNHLDALLRERQMLDTETPYISMSLREYVAERIRIWRGSTFSPGTKIFLTRCRELVSVADKRSDPQMAKILTTCGLFARDMCDTFKIDLLETLVKKLEGPNAKGGFRRKLVKKGFFSPKLDLGRWGIHKVAEAMQSKFSLTDNKRGLNYENVERLQISRITPLSIKELYVRDRLHIVGDATAFAFIYPVDENSTLPKNDEALTFIFEAGGFVYLDKHSRIVRMTGLKKSLIGEIGFQGPYRWTGESNLPIFNFHPVQDNEYREHLAVEFAWVPPRTLSLKDNGGFLFKFVSSNWKNKTEHFFVYRLQARNSDNRENTDPGAKGDYYFTVCLREFGDELEYEEGF